MFHEKEDSTLGEMDLKITNRLKIVNIFLK
jgi:hypothetical protein